MLKKDGFSVRKGYLPSKHYKLKPITYRRLNVSKRLCWICHKKIEFTIENFSE